MDQRKGKYNSFGYLDMTAYLAIRNVQRARKQKNGLKPKKTAGHRWPVGASPDRRSVQTR